MKKVVNAWNAERVRKYPGLENLSDIEAENVIVSLTKIAHVFVSIYRSNPEKFLLARSQRRKLAA